MPASLSACARAPERCPTEAQRLRLVFWATRRAPSRIVSKSRLDRPWPWVTMQKRCAPAASAAWACSWICSGDIIACIGVAASVERESAPRGLGAEAAVFVAADGFGVSGGAQGGGVAEVVEAGGRGTPAERLDFGMVLEL